MPDQTIVHSSGLRGAPPQHVHGATTVGKRFVTHRRMRSPDAVKIVRTRSPAVDRRARVASGSARDPDGRRRGRGTAVTRVAPGTRGTPGDSSRRPVDRSPNGGRSEAAVTTSGGSVVDLGRGRPRARRGPSRAGVGRVRCRRASRSCAPAGSGRGEHDRRPVGGAADRPEPVGADDPGAMSRVRAARSAAARVRGARTRGGPGRGAGPRGSVRLTMPTRARVGWSGRFGVGRSAVRGRAVPGGDPVRTPGRGGSRGPRPARGHGRRACGTAGVRGSSRCPRTGRARGRSDRCSCPGSSRAAPGARAR